MIEITPPMKAKAAEILESYGIKSGAYDLGHDLLHKVLSLSQSLRSQAGVSEAVAYAPSNPVNGQMHLPDAKTFFTDAERMEWENDGWEIKPLYARAAPIEITEGQELTQTMSRSLPGGQMDESSYSAIEDALDAIQAPMCDGGGQFLNLVQRIAALQGETR